MTLSGRQNGSLQEVFSVAAAASSFSILSTHSSVRWVQVLLRIAIVYFSSDRLAQPQANLSHGDYAMPEPQMPSAYGGNYNMPQASAPPSQNAFFSPQTAFYAPNPQPATSGMEYFSQNPLFNVGFNVVEQGMKDFTGRTVNMLPNEVTATELATVNRMFSLVR